MIMNHRPTEKKTMEGESKKQSGRTKKIGDERTTNLGLFFGDRQEVGSDLYENQGVNIAFGSKSALARTKGACCCLPGEEKKSIVKKLSSRLGGPRVRKSLINGENRGQKVSMTMPGKRAARRAGRRLLNKLKEGETKKNDDVEVLIEEAGILTKWTCWNFSAKNGLQVVGGQKKKKPSSLFSLGGIGRLLIERTRAKLEKIGGQGGKEKREVKTEIDRDVVERNIGVSSFFVRLG